MDIPPTLIRKYIDDFARRYFYYKIFLSWAYSEAGPFDMWARKERRLKRPKLVQFSSHYYSAFVSTHNFRGFDAIV